MPSAGLIRRISALGLAAAAVGVPAGGAAAAVPDATPPTAAIGGYRNHAAGPMNLLIAANDTGSGLRYAEAQLQGGPLVRSVPAVIGPACKSAADLDCVRVKQDIQVNVDTNAVPDGDHPLTVRVVDRAGNAYTEVKPVSVENHLDLGSPVQTLTIGSGQVDNPQPQPNPQTGPGGGVGGAQSGRCRAPRLSFALSQKPLRRSRNVPVLLARKAYRFTGRLTCVINGKRKSAPKRTRVDIYNKLGRRELRKGRVLVGASGKLSVRLKVPSSRSIIFRFRNGDGTRAQVTIKVKVERNRKSSKR